MLGCAHQIGDVLKARKGNVKKDDEYLKLIVKAGEAMIAEQRNEIAKAAQAWTEVERIDPSDEYAESRGKGLQAYKRLS